MATTPSQMIRKLLLALLFLTGIGCFPAAAMNGFYFNPDSFTDPQARHFAQAVADGDIQKAIGLAQQIPQGVNVTAPDGVTGLLIAVERFNKPMITALLKAGANPNGGPNRAPIALAIRAKDLTIARLLLMAGAEPNGTIGTEPALYKSALIGDVPGAALLLQYHADPNRGDQLGTPPTFVAAGAGNWQMVLFLLDHGASIWTTNEPGGTLALYTSGEHLTPTSPEGQALARVITRLKDAGYPWPPPSPKHVRALRAEGDWPPPQAR